MATKKYNNGNYSHIILNAIVFQCSILSARFYKIADF